MSWTKALAKKKLKKKPAAAKPKPRKFCYPRWFKQADGSWRVTDLVPWSYVRINRDTMEEDPDLIETFFLPYKLIFIESEVEQDIYWIFQPDLGGH